MIGATELEPSNSTKSIVCIKPFASMPLDSRQILPILIFRNNHSCREHILQTIRRQRLLQQCHRFGFVRGDLPEELAWTLRRTEFASVANGNATAVSFQSINECITLRRGKQLGCTLCHQVSQISYLEMSTTRHHRTAGVYIKLVDLSMV